MDTFGLEPTPDFLDGIGARIDPMATTTLEVLGVIEAEDLLSGSGLLGFNLRRPFGMSGIERGGSLLKIPRLPSSPLRRWKLLPLCNS